MGVSYGPVLCAMQGNSSVCTLQSVEHCNREWSGGIALHCSGDVRLAGLPSGAAAPPYSSVGPGADFARLAWALHQSKAPPLSFTRAARRLMHQGKASSAPVTKPPSIFFKPNPPLPHYPTSMCKKHFLYLPKKKRKEALHALLESR